MADVTSWKSAQVLEWLVGLNDTFKKYVDAFRTQGVDGDMLLEIDDDLLKSDFGVTTALHRKKILKAIDELKAAADGSAGGKRKADTEAASPAKKARVEPAAPAPVAAAPAPVAPAPGGTPDSIEVVFSFDTTGSMYACLGQVKRNVQETITRLLREIPHIRIALVAHGDYGDEKQTYLMKSLNFTSDAKTLVDWITNVGSTNGFDGDEAYEYVLREVQSLGWSPSCTNRSLVLIGDSNPHPLNSNNPYNIDWRVEGRNLASKSIRVYAVHALGYRWSLDFYRDIAQMTGGVYLELAQFSTILDFLLSICYRENSIEQLQRFENEVQREGRMSRNLRALFDRLAGRAAGAAAAAPVDGMTPVDAGRFQSMMVDVDCPIRDFAERNGLVFRAGKGFYEFTKPEHISMEKEIVLQDKTTGDMFTGDAARNILGITDASSAAKKKIKPGDYDNFRIYVQSTSYNRKLIGGTRFLYEVDTDK